MSRGKAGVRLPQSLEKELGLELRIARGGRRAHTVRGRKEQRKVDRVEKRRAWRGRPHSNGTRRKVAAEDEYEDEDEDDEEHEEFEGFSSEPETRGLATRPISSSPAPKSILRKPPPLPSPSLSSDNDFQSLRSLSPEIVLDATSRSYKHRLAQDEDEIAVLEKKLGMKKSKKLGRSFDQDGLGDLLDGIDSEDENSKRKREEREWLQTKRIRRSEPVARSGPDGREQDGVAFDDMEDDISDISEDFSDDAQDEDLKAPPPQATKVRENPYVPPVAPTATTAKYIPPSLRSGQVGDDQAQERLHRQIQGHLNKLSEANLISILNEIEKLYRSHPRQDVHSILIDLLLSLFCTPSAHPPTFVLLHAAFCSALYKVIGTDFGATLLARLVDRFDHYYHSPSPTASSNSKEPLNLLSLLSHLFTFHLTSSALIYSFINLLLTPLSEPSTEILLRIIRDIGPQLRSDDPVNLKSVVLQTQSTASSLPPPVSVRTQFMLETITDLKDNKMRDSTATSAFTREHITRLRKTLGSLNSSTRTLRATEPLRLTLQDLRNSDRRGKWWLVGASWKGSSPPPNTHTSTSTSNSPTSTHPTQHPPPSSSTEIPTPHVPNYRLLAHNLSLSTPLQLSILTAIASASTATDAFIRLGKLRLKRAQEPEVARVLLRCCGREDGWNSYYADLAIKLCTAETGEKGGMRKRFEFAFWGMLRAMGDGDDSSYRNHNLYGDDSNDDFSTGGGGGGRGENISTNEIFNVAKLYAHLIYSNILSLAILRPIDLPLLNGGGQTGMFLELLFIQIFLHCKGQQEEVSRVFGRLGEAKALVARVRAWLRDVRGSDFMGKGKKREFVRRGVRVAAGVLDTLGLEGEGAD